MPVADSSVFAFFSSSPWTVRSTSTRPHCPASSLLRVLVPLALEQQTVRAARAEAVSVLAAHGRDTTAKGQAAEISSLKRKLDFLEKEMRFLNPFKFGGIFGINLPFIF